MKLDIFRKYEDYFHMTKNGYIRNHRRFISNEIADAYEKITGRKVNRNWTCGSCVLNFYKEVGEWYFREVRKEEEKDKSTPLQKAMKKRKSPAKKKKTITKTKKTVKNDSTAGKDREGDSQQKE